MAEALPPSLEDTPKNRQKLFVKYCINQFDNAAKLCLMQYFDHRNVETKCSSNAGTSAGAGVSAAVNFIAPGLGIVVGGATKVMVGKAVQKIEQKKGSLKQKKISDLLRGYDKDKPEWRNMLAEVFNTIFMNYTVQLTHILSEPSDDMSFYKLIFKVASDVITRIFQYLEDASEEEVYPEFLYRAFLQGKSEAGFLATFFNKVKQKDLGREVRTKEAKIKTSELFENVDILLLPDKRVLLKGKKASKYHYRRVFPGEKLELVKNQLQPSLEDYCLDKNIIDNYEHL